MTSKERVRAVFNGEIPDRIPMWCGASPEFMEKAKKELGVSTEEEVLERFHDDFRRVYSRYVGPDRNGKSDFGVERHGIGYGQPVSHPLQDASLEEIHGYTWPSPDWYDVTHIREEALAYQEEYAIMCGEWSPIFHDAIDLLGMESMMILMYEEPEKVHAVLQHITDFYYEITKRTLESAADVIDIFFMGNDLGSQTGPLMSAEMFEEFLAPQIKRLTDLAHSYNVFTMMHCCGSFYQLIPSLIQAGVDALQSLQPATPEMQAESLKKSFGGDIIINGCIDSVNVLINGTKEETESYTRHVIEVMKPGGGFILSPSHDYLLEETPVENVLTMYDIGLEEGKYDI